ncbi:MAG: PTS fructose transporter subunit IIA [Candidatus Nitrotoga sp.]
MIGILLITHNGLGDSLMDCVKHVMGDVPPNLKSIAVLADDNVQKKIVAGRELIAQLNSGEGVLLLTDLFGATPCNIAQQLCQAGQVTCVTGVNLPMLLRVLGYCQQSLTEVTQKALTGGRENIISIDTLLPK